MDEDRMSYVVGSIYDMVEACNLSDDMEEYVDKYKVAEIFYKSGLLRDDEYDSICDYFKENDRVFESIVNKTADLDKMYQDRLDAIESFLFGGTSNEAISGIIQWIESPDCDKGDLIRLKEAIEKYV
jgi:hypothetical protein